MAVLGTILVLLAVLTIHEFGHFVMCVRLGIPVKSLHLGIPIGPQLRFRLGKYLFTISLLPFGAAVVVDNEAMWRAPLWKRVLIMLAGPGANFFSVVIAGMIVSWSLAGALGGLAVIGVVAGVVIKFVAALIDGTIPLALAGSQVVGPVGIVAQGGELVASGKMELFSLFAMISVWLGLTNLLPIPGLDGGQVATNILVSLGMPRKWANTLTYACLGLLLVFVLAITARDIANLF